MNKQDAIRHASAKLDEGIRAHSMARAMLVTADVEVPGAVRLISESVEPAGMALDLINPEHKERP